LVILLVGLDSVYRPELAAIAGLVRVFGFIAYVSGYSTGDPKKRMQGSFGAFRVVYDPGGRILIQVRSRFTGYLGLLASLVLTIETSLRILGVL
jgi:hypothetical protein